MSGVDFTACRRVPGRAYNGANGKKIAVEYEGGIWPLVDERTNDAALAPVFDCGSCLLPQTDETVMRKVLSCEAELKARIYSFPASMLKQGGRKICYFDFILSSGDPDFRRSLENLLPRIQALDVEALIADTPYLSSLQREFLATYLNARHSELFGDAR